MTKKEIDFDKIKVGDQILVKTIITKIDGDLTKHYHLEMVGKNSIKKHFDTKMTANDLINDAFKNLDLEVVDDMTYSAIIYRPDFKNTLLKIAKAIKSEDKKAVKKIKLAKVGKKEVAQFGIAKKRKATMTEKLNIHYNNFLISYEATVGLGDPQYRKGYVRYDIVEKMLDKYVLQRLSHHLSGCTLHADENGRTLVPVTDFQGFAFCL